MPLSCEDLELACNKTPKTEGARIEVDDIRKNPGLPRHYLDYVARVLLRTCCLSTDKVEWRLSHISPPSLYIQAYQSIQSVVDCPAQDLTASFPHTCPLSQSFEASSCSFFAFSFISPASGFPSSLSSSANQPLHIVTARSHFLNIFLLAASSIFGSKTV